MVTTVSPKRRRAATMRRYPCVYSETPNQETVAMQLHCDAPRLTGIRACAAPMRCPHCGDPMIAPEMSEFVVGGEIRHHWQCDHCGRSSSSAFWTSGPDRRTRNR
jgi:hypothetical protein